MTIALVKQLDKQRGQSIKLYVSKSLPVNTVYILYASCMIASVRIPIDVEVCMPSVAKY